MKLTDITSQFDSWSIEKQTSFLELFLFNLTVMNRSILSYQDWSATRKVKVLKWSNELSHHIWNILSDVRRNEDNIFGDRLERNIRFSIEQANDLGPELGATLKLTYQSFDQ